MDFKNNNLGYYQSSQLQQVYEYLQKHCATATMVAEALDIYRPSLCRLKRELEKAGLLVEVNKDYCGITRRIATYLTTNPKFVPKFSQLRLF